MVSTLRSWWQKNRKPVGVVGIIVACVLVIALIVAILGGYLFNWDWTGLVPYNPPTKESNFQRGKTLWDWLQLLIIPVVLAIGGFWLNQIQKNREQRTTKQQAELERKIARDNQQEITLQAYIDNMSELLLKEHLGEKAHLDELKPQYNELRKIARVRTLTVLQRLDAVRKFSVLLFLHESGLIDKGRCVVELDIANLQGADLRGVHLEEAQLRGAKLQGADLSFAYLSGADLKDANLHGSNLIGADLRETYLEGVELGGANLTGAIITNEQLDAAKSLEGAIMPDGSTHR
jgi:uncharacterized protein YjbI with pentapeptide repeats